MNLFDRELTREKSLMGFKELNRSLTRRKEQTGKSNIPRDRVRKSMPPGKRISSTGKIYYEGRRNRSDLFGEKI